MNLNNTITDNSNLSQLVSKLQVEDNRYARISKAFQIIYWVFIPIYALLTFLDYRESGQIAHLIGGVCFIMSFLVFALFFGVFYKEYKHVDYALPTIEMLKKAAFRYKPFQKKKLWILSAIFFMDAGLSFNQTADFSILEVQIYFLGIMAISVCIGLIIWYYKYKPLRDKALYLIKEIEEE